MDPKRKFAKHLRAAIKAAGYNTPELFAHENSLNKGWVYRFVKGEREPMLSSMEKLARSLDVTLDELYPMKKRKV